MNSIIASMESDVDEEMKISIMITLNRFMSSEDLKLSFPTSFLSNERRLVHTLCKHFGLKSRTIGKGSNRFVLCVKDENLLKIDEPNLFTLSNQTLLQLSQFSLNYPLGHKERLDLLLRTEKFGNPPPEEVDKNKAVGRINIGLALIPSCFQFNYSKDPINSTKMEIITSINNNQISMISGDIGVGKTTQVPKYILEFAQARKKAVRLIFVQNSRLLAVAMAEYLASQLAEKVGQTVGYQIRLESRVSPTTVLTFCTPWVFLRNLMSGDPDVSRITHILIDDVNDRAKAVDLILVYLKLSLLPKNKNTKLVLLSSRDTFTEQLFSKYFAGLTSEVVHVGEGKKQSNTECFLGETLAYLEIFDHENLAYARKISTDNITKDKLRGLLAEQCSLTHKHFREGTAFNALIKFLGTHYNGPSDFREKLEKSIAVRDGVFRSSLVLKCYGGRTSSKFPFQQIPYFEMGANLPALLDSVMEEAWHAQVASAQALARASEALPPIGTPPQPPTLSGTLGMGGVRCYLDTLVDLHITYGMDVDRPHSTMDFTLLMLASGLGLTDVVEKLVYNGACLNRFCILNGWTALDWASAPKRSETASLLNTYLEMAGELPFQEARLITDDKRNCSSEAQLQNLALSWLYYQRCCHNNGQTACSRDVVVQLILKLMHGKDTKLPDGAGDGPTRNILVFLPTFDEISRTKDILLSDSSLAPDLSNNRVRIYVLYAEMHSSDLKQIFQPLADGCSKIILATDIAETSVFLPDIAYVIDTGLIDKEIFDYSTNSSRHKVCWISKANYDNRIKILERSSQPRTYYHLYTHLRFANLVERHPCNFSQGCLSELLLQAKYLAPVNSSLQDFFSKAPEPPSSYSIRTMVQGLKAMDAFDDCLDLTELGQHLVDLPIHPKLGKMILYAIILKCLDPVLTIACALAFPGAPCSAFVSQECGAGCAPINTLNTKRFGSMTTVKYRYSEKTFSDHMILLRVFQGWQKARVDGWEKQFCLRNCLSPSNLDTIFYLRAHILGQLRASGLVRSRGCNDIRDLNSNSDNWSTVKAVLCTSLYPNLARVISSGAKERRADLGSYNLSNGNAKHRGMVGLDVTLILISPSTLSYSPTPRTNQRSPLTVTEAGEETGASGDEPASNPAATQIASQNNVAAVYNLKAKFAPDVCFAAITLPTPLTTSASDNGLGWASICPSEWIIFDEYYRLPAEEPVPCATNTPAYNSVGNKSASPTVPGKEGGSVERRVGCGGYVSGCTLVSPITVLLFAGPNRTPKDYVQDIENPDSIQNMANLIMEDDSDSGKSDGNHDPESERPKHPENSLALIDLKLDERLIFQNGIEVLRNVLNLRQKFHSLALRRLKHPSKPWSAVDETVMKMVISVLTQEESFLGMAQPSGVGQRPKPMSAEHSNNLDTDLPSPTSVLSFSSTSTSPFHNNEFSNNVEGTAGMMPNNFMNQNQPNLNLSTAFHNLNIQPQSSHVTLNNNNYQQPFIPSMPNSNFDASFIPNANNFQNTLTHGKNPLQQQAQTMAKFYVIKPTNDMNKIRLSPYQPPSITVGSPEDYCNYRHLDSEIKAILETIQFLTMPTTNDFSDNNGINRVVIGFIFNPQTNIFLGIVRSIVKLSPVTELSFGNNQTVVQLDWLVKKMIDLNVIRNTLQLPMFSKLEPSINSDQIICELDTNVVPYLIKYFEE